MNDFYVVFSVKRDVICEDGNHRKRVVMDAGIDVIGGPYATFADAVNARPSVLRQHCRLAACAALSLASGDDNVTVEVRRIRLGDIGNYNARLAAAKTKIACIEHSTILQRTRKPDPITEYRETRARHYARMEMPIEPLSPYMTGSATVKRHRK